MTLIIDGTDFSDYIQQKTDITETPRYINGANADTAINGDAIYDRVATKYDPSFLLKPMPQDKVAELLLAVEAEEVEITYTSVLQAQNRSITAQGEVGSITYIDEFNGERVYAEAVIRFTEK